LDFKATVILTNTIILAECLFGQATGRIGHLVMVQEKIATGKSSVDAMLNKVLMEIAEEYDLT